MENRTKFNANPTKSIRNYFWLHPRSLTLISLGARAFERRVVELWFKNKLLPVFLTLKLMERTPLFRLNVARFRSLTTEPSSTIAHRISPTHRISDALDRSASGQPAYLRVSKGFRSENGFICNKHT